MGIQVSMVREARAGFFYGINLTIYLLGHENRVTAATPDLKKRLRKTANDCDMLCC